ncbi:SIMPL domain-containing protein [Marinibactrum halimedae]|uniref:Oxidative stress defense protein n=1 Tax=Marinibactrum halimedae TaxID=1444977 RepID=A0AA37T0E1_9GAMM|nr:SIMPL domain-containing protein [Marinibactrum halimedae]MCD9461128.1 SIMPL domain-containing protein [Marinibactrum halimedae]GLS24644.1 oxidative stress defense protein [Marinibactrum halimedae]
MQIKAILLSAVLVLGHWALSPSAHAGEIRVVGVGEVSAIPDQASVSIHLKHTAKTVAEAKDAVDQQAITLQKSLQKLGIKPKRINAGTININPEHRWEDRRKIFVGYQASRPIAVSIDDLEAYPKVLHLLSEQKISDFNTNGFEFSHREALQRDAMEQAFHVAQAKAQLLAKLSGTKIIAVREIIEQGAEPPIAYGNQNESLMMAKSAPADSYSAGEYVIDAHLTVVFITE